MAFPRNIAGEKFGRLTALYPAGKYRREFVWMCECECKERVAVKLTNLRSGNTRSCGCIRK